MKAEDALDQSQDTSFDSQHIFFNTILLTVEKGTATHSSILAWRIPWTEKSLVDCSPWGRKELGMTE